MKVLIVVDMQYDFCGPDGSLTSKEAQSIVPLVANKIEEMANPNTVVIFTKDTHNENYLNTQEGKNLPVPHCIKGTHGHAIIDKVFCAYLDHIHEYKHLSDIIPIYENERIEKPAFGSIELQNMLYNLNDTEPIEEIILMGVCTGICVLSNSILCKATLPEVPVNVIADCCACVTPESHKAALEAMKLCQINII